MAKAREEEKESHQQKHQTCNPNQGSTTYSHSTSLNLSTLDNNNLNSKHIDT